MGSPQTAVDILGEARKYGLDPEGVVSANRFNYLLSQLYAAGDSESECIERNFVILCRLKSSL